MLFFCFFRASCSAQVKPSFHQLHSNRPELWATGTERQCVQITFDQQMHITIQHIEDRDSGYFFGDTDFFFHIMFFPETNS